MSANQVLILVGVGCALGWRVHGSPAEFLGAVGLLLLLRFAVLWIGIHLAMVAGKPELVQAVQILVWPVGFLSNALAAPKSMPGWLGTVVEWNPMSQTATAVRDLLGGPGGEPGHAWASVAWPLGLLAMFFPSAVRRFARLGGVSKVPHSTHGARHAPPLPQGRGRYPHSPHRPKPQVRPVRGLSSGTPRARTGHRGHRTGLSKHPLAG